MKITLVLVSSLDGYLNNRSDKSIYDWTSKEDQEYFFDLIKQHQIIVMGKNTYLSNKNVIKLKPGKLRIVLTREPEKFAQETVSGQLEFSKETPLELVVRLQRQQVKNILLVGGSQVATAFLKAGLVNQLLLTIEPIIFGGGLPMFNVFLSEISLKLLEVKKLNKRGTLLLDYEVKAS